MKSKVLNSNQGNAGAKALFLFEIAIMSNQWSNQGIIQSGGNINAEQLAVGRFATVCGMVNKKINELESNEAAEVSSLAELLKQLQTAIENDPTLHLTEKVDALEKIQEIAEAGSSPNSETKQKLVKAASRTLKGMLAELPNATQFIEACTKLLPLITKIFGF